MENKITNQQYITHQQYEILKYIKKHENISFDDLKKHYDGEQCYIDDISELSYSKALIYSSGDDKLIKLTSAGENYIKEYKYQNLISIKNTLITIVISVITSLVTAFVAIKLGLS